MIEIVMDKERNLKNLKQIGTPREDNKIYIENLAYSKIREDSYQDKRVFVLMGHTERMEGRYATFVEAVIPVKNAEFTGILPQWNNSMWSQVFREIKRVYEEMIIVGWAVDVRGMSPTVTPELERVHREHFGGVHQVLFLVDSLERDETFYIYKENKLVPKDGFYIYYRARKNDDKSDPENSSRTNGFEVIDLNKEEPEEINDIKTVDVDIITQRPEPVARGRYREMMQQASKPTESGNTGLAIAIAMLLFIVGVGAYENRDAILGSQAESSKAAWSTENAGEEAEAGATYATDASETAEAADATQTTETAEAAGETETAEATVKEGYEIPVEELTESSN